MRPEEGDDEGIREELETLYIQYADSWLRPLLDREGPVWVAAALERHLADESERSRSNGDGERSERYQAAARIYQVAILALRGLGWPEVYHPPLVSYGEQAPHGIVASACIPETERCDSAIAGEDSPGSLGKSAGGGPLDRCIGPGERSIPAESESGGSRRVVGPGSRFESEFDPGAA